MLGKGAKRNFRQRLLCLRQQTFCVMYRECIQSQSVIAEYQIEDCVEWSSPVFAVREM